MEPKDKQDQKESAYTVIRERVKKRPVNVRKLLRNALFIVLGALLFGFVASLVIARMTPLLTANRKEPVQFAEDPTPVPITPVPDPTSTPTPTPDPEPDDEKEEEPVPTPVPEPPPDPEKESAERIRENKLLYSDLRKIAAEPQRSLVTVTGISVTEDWFEGADEVSRVASGIIVADNGISYLVLTNTAQLEGAERIVATLYDGTIVDAEIVKSDPATGLGIVSLSKRLLPTLLRGELPIVALGNSYVVAQGDPVIAIGAPTGYSDSVVFGQITSTTNRVVVTDGSYPLLMTNMQGAVSGSGVLINMDGAVVGYITPQFSQGTGGNAITAIPISQYKRKVEILSNSDPIAYLGILGEDVDEEEAEHFGLPRGIYVTGVEADSPAFAAGIRRGDILCRIGDVDLENTSVLSSRLDDGLAGTDQTILVRRLGAGGYVEMEIEVAIGSI